MRTKRKEENFIKKPYYDGGIKAMRTFIKSNLRYPEEALKNKIEGQVHLRYSINYQGKVVKTKIISGLGYGCNEEAERIVKLFTFIVPKAPRKLKILFHKTIRINFKLPKPKVKKGLHLNYQIKKEKRKSYEYTINF